MKDAKYYKDYRSVKSKVAKHLSLIQLDLSNAHDDHNKNSDPSAVSPSGDSSQHSEESLFSNLGHIQQSLSAFECDLTVHEDTVENESRVSTRLGQICPSVTDDSIFDIDAACENRCLSDFDSDSSDDTLDDSELEDDLRVWVSLFNIPINAQVIRRLSEKSNATRELIIPNTGIVKKRHNNGPRIQDYEKVSLRMKKAEETTDLATSDEERSKRKRKPAKKLYESDSDSDLSDDNEGPKRKPASSSALTSDSPGSQSLFAATRCTYTPPPLPSLHMSAVSSPSVSHRPPQATPSPVAGGCSSTPVRPVQAPLAHSIGTGAVTQILTILEEMREEQRGIKRLLNQLVLQGGPVPDNMNALPEGISFPVSSLEAMEALEELLQDANNATAVARYMYTIGGVDIREMVDRFMKETLTNNVAKMYNMKGLKGKQKFGACHC
ncbi:uncharacterized protein LOC128204423 [Mya arenaria]|uniref:uncharacterized protein LOC128204423 n=1 Tax=Mya arenaria TaxID=6604 RepID=UPI0022E53B67|nr:uncharacterized protein LOC128204423 [Mya arenaria]